MRPEHFREITWLAESYILGEETRRQLVVPMVESEKEEIVQLRTRRILLAALLVGAAAFRFTTPGVAAQDPAPAPAPKQQDPPKPKPNADSAVQSADDQPKWDPLRAEKDLDVGKYYMKKGDLDAAIDRFQDAAEAKPGYAIPYRYLGEAYEKKGQKKAAVKAYQRYLDLFPHAEDADKIRKKIEKLHQEIDKEKNSG